MDLKFTIIHKIVVVMELILTMEIQLRYCYFRRKGGGDGGKKGRGIWFFSNIFPGIYSPVLYSLLVLYRILPSQNL